MDGRRSAAWRFGWLWTAYGVSTFGTRFAFDAFALVALLVLHAGPAEVSLLAAVGPAVGAVLSVPLGPWVEYRRKRPVMIATDLVRCAVLLSVPLAYALDALTVAQLLVVSVTVAAADITFQAAVGAYVKDVVPGEELLRANGRLESTTWTATMLGPPLGGAAIGWFGPVTTVVADAVSYLLSAGALGAAGGGDRRPERPEPRPRLRAGDLLDGWRYILRSRELRPLFLNTVLVSGLIMASSPLLVVLMVGPLGFAPWQYGLAFAVPCVGGLVGARLSRRLVARFGARRVLGVAGTLRACWSVGLAFVGPGAAGLVLVIVIEFGLITSMGVFNPVFATRRLERTPADRVVRTLSAWSATSKASIAALTALWGLLASVTGPRTAIAVAGALLLATPLLLPRGREEALQERDAEAEAKT
ncbi:MFS transporter [Streptomyces cellulosae]|uniref:MFS transporter n=1 Tax=Streptomyces thermocarboxydus TaxID=59299 RepID=A0ABU3J779_9ACTN|nr:MFS transporter [Streptomyces sp. McG7]MDT6970923.1 MFS transporter [Streptomyces thermocarboxydus]MYQ32433.1 MFS transporter [Streptomyces sp. SID4956]THC58999.1 MFS transporter [Streptomyces sp. Akac8]WSB45799.1 MFS transporter [Streptomyces cellulosae]